MRPEGVELHREQKTPSRNVERLRLLAARTGEALESAIAEATATIPVKDVVNCFHHFGYHLKDQPL